MAIRPGSKVKRKGSGNGDGTGCDEQPADAVEPARKMVGNPVAAAKAANLSGPTNMYRQAPIGPHGMTLKQTAFVQALLSGTNQSDAYRAAYDTSNMTDKSVHIEACKLMKNPKVKQALYEARHEAGKLLRITAETLTDMAVESYETAVNAGNSSHMTGAIALIAKLNGLMVERSEKRIEKVDGGKDRVALLADLNKLGKALGITIIDSTATEVQPENMGGHIDGDVQGE